MRSPAKTTALLAAMLTAVAWTAGCGRGGTHASSGHSPAATPGGLPAGVVGATAVPTAVPNDTAARRNVTISSCRAAHDGWQATGTATNPDGRHGAYTITVFFTTTGGTVIGTGQTQVAVKSHSDQPWSVTGTFHPAPQTRCVLRGAG